MPLQTEWKELHLPVIIFLENDYREIRKIRSLEVPWSTMTPEKNFESKSSFHSVNVNFVVDLDIVNDHLKHINY